MSEPDPVLISTQARWDSVAKKLGAQQQIAVDLEGNGFFRYPERLCLIQLAADGSVYLLDPLAVPDLSALGKLLADRCIEKIFHSCDWDLRSLDRGYGFHLQGLFDTSVAARLVGLNQVGLGNVLKGMLGVELNKSKSLQRQDWTLRPLQPESIAYASADVFYLARLRQKLGDELTRLGRLDWVAEECRRLENLRAAPLLSPDVAFWQMKGARRLGPVQRARLRELYLYREQLARETDRPPFKLLMDETLLALAAEPPADLSKVPGLSWLAQHNRLSELAAVLHRTARLPGLELPRLEVKAPLRMSAEARKRFAAWKNWRQTKGKAMGLDPALLWPMRSLEFMALHPEVSGFESPTHTPPDVRAWQEKVFGDEVNGLRQQLAVGAYPPPSPHGSGESAKKK